MIYERTESEIKQKITYCFGHNILSDKSVQSEICWIRISKCWFWSIPSSDIFLFQSKFRVDKFVLYEQSMI